METAPLELPLTLRSSSAKDASSTAEALSTTETSRTKDALPTVLRSLALVVVVTWHGALSTLRWDGRGPHAGNALHLVPGGFVLTWFLQVMPLFFLVGGAVSLGSLRRNFERGGSSTQWVTARVAKLVIPAIPLVAIGGLVAAFASPATVGLMKLALSPLWFLGVYAPITMLAPTLHRLYARFGNRAVFGLALATGVVQVLRLVGFEHRLLWALALLGTWSCAFLGGFSIDELRRNRLTSARLCFAGLLVMIMGAAFGLPASMVAVRGESISNMGDVTVSLLGLIAFQAGLIGLFGDRLVRIASRPSISRLVRFVDSHQAAIYVGHLPLWVLTAWILQSTSFAVGSVADFRWLALRPMWFVITLGCGVMAARLPMPAKSAPTSKMSSSLH
jgi:Acyltransferase family